MTTLQILESKDMVNPTDWCRPLKFESMDGGRSDSYSFENMYSGLPENNAKWVRVEDVFGQNDDLLGLAASWQDPSNRTAGEQYVLEAFYRFYITPHTHLTPDIQVVIDPANTPTKDAVTIFGLRLRTLY